MDKPRLEESAVQFMRDVYDILYKEEDGTYDTKRSWKDEERKEISNKLLDIVGQPEVGDLLDEAKDCVMRVVNISDVEDMDKIWAFCKNSSVMLNTNGLMEAMLLCTESLLQKAVAEGLTKVFLNTLERAVVDGKTGKYENRLLIVCAG